MGDLITTKNRKGFEEPTAKEDIEIPRVRLLQALSPEVAALGSTLKPGQIVNSITKAVMPEHFMPIFKFTNWIRFNPRDARKEGFDPAYKPGELIWTSSDPTDERVIKEGSWGPDGTPPLATKFLNFFCYFPGQETPVILSFSRTSFKAGKHLLSLAQMLVKDGKPADMFQGKYKLGSKQEIGATGTPYYIYTIESAGYASDDEASQGGGMWTQFRSKDIKVELEAEE